MKAAYYYADPTGNITLLAPLPPAGTDAGREAEMLMRLEPAAEQAGFLGGGGPGYELSLQMAGGEFCGNAALSAAAVYCLNAGINCEEAETVRVSVSGAAEPVPVRIRETGSGCFEGTVSMPAPLEIFTYSFRSGGEEYAFPAVRFEGITHLLSFSAVEKKTAERIVKEQCSALQADALGLMLIDKEAGTLLPVVYVPKSGTLFWESSCASGTAAAGAWLRKAFGGGKWEFTEPGGRLIIEAPEDGRLLLTGSVRVTAKEMNPPATAWPSPL